MKTRILSLILCVLMLVSMIPVSVSAAGTGTVVTPADFVSNQYTCTASGEYLFEGDFPAGITIKANRDLEVTLDGKAGTFAGQVKFSLDQVRSNGTQLANARTGAYTIQNFNIASSSMAIGAHSTSITIQNNKMKALDFDASNTTLEISGNEINSDGAYPRYDVGTTTCAINLYADKYDLTMTGNTITASAGNAIAVFGEYGIQSALPANHGYTNSISATDNQITIASEEGKNRYILRTWNDLTYAPVAWPEEYEITEEMLTLAEQIASDNTLEGANAEGNSIIGVLVRSATASDLVASEHNFPALKDAVTPTFNIIFRARNAAGQLIGTPFTLKAVLGEDLTIPVKAGTANAYAREGYTFVWNSNTKGTGAYEFADGATIPSDVVEEIYLNYALKYPTSDGGYECYFNTKWVPNTDTLYKVQHILMNVDGTKIDRTLATYKNYGTTDSLSAAAPIAIEGYTAMTDLIEQAPIKGDGSTLVKIYYKKNTYKLTFDANGGNFADGTTTVVNEKTAYNSTIVAPADPTRTGYAFAGWEIYPAKMPAGDLTVKAIWTENATYTITYVVDGKVYKTYEFKYDTPITGIDVAAPTKVGSTFSGWDAALPETMPAKNLVLNAVWGTNSYTIKFMDAENLISEATLAYGAAVTAPAAPTKEGFTFAGWIDADGNAVTVPATMPASNLTIYASWTENEKPVETKPTLNNVLFALAARYAQRFDVLVSAENATVTGDMSIKYKRNGTVNIDVAEGYKIVDVIANGQSLGAVETVTFKKVTAPQTLVILTELLGAE